MHLFLPTVDCGTPNVPGNGFVENIQTTVGGAQIFFRCNSRYVPVGRMSATCISSNGTWTPDPADLMCNGETTGTYFAWIGCVTPAVRNA